MSWDIKDIDVTDINLATRPRSRYKNLYQKIMDLKVGKGFEIETESAKEAGNIRNSVSHFLKQAGMSDKYIASNRLNKFYCGRIK